MNVLYKVAAFVVAATGYTIIVEAIIVYDDDDDAANKLRLAIGCKHCGTDSVR